MRLSFRFKMSVSDYRKMMISRTFGDSVLRRVFLVGLWIFFTALFVAERLGAFELSRVVHVCALLVMVALPAAAITMEINIAKYKEAYLAGFKAERQIIADEKGLTFRNCNTNESGENSWAEVTKVEELKDVFMIQLNRREEVILPKRGMGDNRKINEFRELVKKKIAARFYPLRNSFFRQ